MKSNTQVRTRRGQALAEFVLGMIGFCVLLMALFQISLLGKAGVEAQGEARGEAEDQITKWTGATGADTHILSWLPGNDGLAYTADDIPKIVPGADDLSTFSINLTQPIDINQLFDTLGLESKNEYNWAIVRNSIVESANLRKGDKIKLIPIEPILRALVLPNQTSLAIREEIFMPHLLLLGKDEIP